MNILVEFIHWPVVQHANVYYVYTIRLHTAV